MLSYEEKLNRNVTWAMEEGGMFFDRRSAVHDTLQRLTKSLDELGVDYAIADAMAMFLHGFRRFTEVVDVLVTREGLQKVHEALEGRGYVKPFEASKNLRDARTGVKIDFLISGQILETESQVRFHIRFRLTLRSPLRASELSMSQNSSN
jgi:hypothetical protein